MLAVNGGAALRDINDREAQALAEGLR